MQRLIINFDKSLEDATTGIIEEKMVRVVSPETETYCKGGEWFKSSEYTYFEEPYTTEQRARELKAMAISLWNSDGWLRQKPAPIIEIYWKTKQKIQLKGEK